MLCLARLQSSGDSQCEQTHITLILSTALACKRAFVAQKIPCQFIKIDSSKMASSTTPQKQITLSGKIIAITGGREAKSTFQPNCSLLIQRIVALASESQIVASPTMQPQSTPSTSVRQAMNSSPSHSNTQASFMQSRPTLPTRPMSRKPSIRSSRRLVVSMVWW